MSKHHDLKCILPYFNEVKELKKQFEVRRNDRDFQAGDTVTLHLFDPKTGMYGHGEIYADLSSLDNLGFIMA